MTTETQQKLKPYAVTLEWASKISYVTVAVEATDPAAAVRLACETVDYDQQDDYDDGGETYVGHVAEFETLEDAQNAGTRDGDPLPIPFADMEDSEKVSVLTGQRDKLLAMLKQSRECIAWCRKHHKDPQSGEGIPIEAIIDATISEVESAS